MMTGMPAAIHPSTLPTAAAGVTLDRQSPRLELAPLGLYHDRTAGESQQPLNLPLEALAFLPDASQQVRQIFTLDSDDVNQPADAVVPGDEHTALRPQRRQVQRQLLAAVANRRHLLRPHSAGIACLMALGPPTGRAVVLTGHAYS